MIKFKASFDDGCQLDLKTAELLDKYGVEDVTFYVPSEWHYVNRLHGDVPLTEEELRLLAGRYNIGSHTKTHQMLTRIPVAQAYHEITDSKDKLEELLDITIEDFCYPRGYANDDIRQEVGRHYKRARNTLVGSLEVPEDPLWEYTTLHIAGKRRTEYEGTSWQKEGERLLNLALEKDANDEVVVYHFWGHSWEIERYFDWGEFENFLKKVKEVMA
jgi:peptidoglycan/xylan/chitin deacetylase (PgdA/CDA1 family)